MSGLPNDAFQRALDEAGRKDPAANETGAGPTSAPRVRGVAFGAAPGAGGKARFGLALDWTGEPADRPRPPQPPLRPRPGRSGDTPSEIAAELGLGAALTLDQLTSRWRDFVWRNHPDRQPVAAREGANRRVAIANTLYDRARRELAKGALAVDRSPERSKNARKRY
jgi:hypothetical protein